MSKAVIFAVAGFIIGAGAGTGITYAVCKGKLEKKYQEYEANLHHLYDIKMKRLDEAPVVDVDDQYEVVDNMSEELQKKYYMEKLKNLGYGVFEAEDYDSEEVNPEYDEDENPSEEPEGIELLNYNDYIRIDDSQLTCISMNYYAGDNTVTDEENELYPGWKDIIGEEWIESIDKDNPTAYILNHDRSMLVDIEFKEGSYKNLVEGIASDEEE